MAQAPGVRAEKRLATDRDSFNLNLHVFRQTRDFYAGTRRESGVMLGEERFIRGIHGGEIVHGCGLLTKHILGKVGGVGSRLAASVICITENVCPRFRPLEFGLDVPVVD